MPSLDIVSAGILSPRSFILFWIKDIPASDGTNVPTSAPPPSTMLIIAPVAPFFLKENLPFNDLPLLPTD